MEDSQIITHFLQQGRRKLRAVVGVKADRRVDRASPMACEMLAAVMERRGITRTNLVKESSIVS
jgi:hypothetical protein